MGLNLNPDKICSRKLKRNEYRYEAYVVNGCKEGDVYPLCLKCCIKQEKELHTGTSIMIGIDKKKLKCVKCGKVFKGTKNQVWPIIGELNRKGE